MILNRCEYIFPDSRMQCNQEAYADFQGDRQKLCKLHTEMMIQNAAYGDLDNYKPIVALNDSDTDELNTKVQNQYDKFKAPEPPAQEQTETPAPTSSENTEQPDINRSDKDQNEVK